MNILDLKLVLIVLFHRFDIANLPLAPCGLDSVSESTGYWVIVIIIVDFEKNNY